MLSKDTQDVIKNIVIVIVLAAVVAKFFNAVYNRFYKQENFFNGLTSSQELCNLSKNNLDAVVAQKNEECDKVVIDKQNTQNDSRNSINNALSCYNYVGNEIVTSKDVDSWCKLSENDMNVIDEVTSKLLKKPEAAPRQFDQIEYKGMLTFNSMDKYSKF